MSAVLHPIQARFEPMTAQHLQEVLRVERQAYDQPWLHSHFMDSLQAGYQAQLLLADNTLLGYFIAMKGVDEVHLLNLTVAPAHQRQGWARVMLEALATWARGQRADWLWLELRAGNLRALQVYQAHGYRPMGRRKNYYPGGQDQREDALVMSLRL